MRWEFKNMNLTFLDGWIEEIKKTEGKGENTIGFSVNIHTVLTIL